MVAFLDATTGCLVGKNPTQSAFESQMSFEDSPRSRMMGSVMRILIMTYLPGTIFGEGVML
jgi:hypothetical protein